jgi:hypothetical protein
MRQSRRTILAVVLILLFALALGVLTLGGFTPTLGDILGVGTPLEDLVQIGPVCNPGDALPFIPFKNSGQAPLQIEGWTLAHASGTFTFPALSLDPGQAIWLWSGSPETYAGASPPAHAAFGRSQGDVIVTDLYAGRADPSWSERTVTLRAPGWLGRSHTIHTVFLAANCDP